MKIISDYLKANMPLPQYLPYARFLLDADLSHTSKLLYTLLLDRATLSQKNNWVDNQGRIYVIYPLSNLAKDLGCCVSSVTRSFAELEKAELAERVRSGFSKPSHILLKVPHTVQNCAVTVCTSAQSDCAETRSMIALTGNINMFATTKAGVTEASVKATIKKLNTVKATKIKSLKANKVKKNAKKATVTLKFKKVKGIKKYEVEYSLKKNFKKSKVKTAKKTTYKGILSKVRPLDYMQDYTKTNYAGNAIYSKWVKKSVKTKK